MFRNIISSFCFSVFCSMALGCGGTEDRTSLDESRLPPPGRPYEFEEVYPDSEVTTETDLILVDRVRWKSETIEFWDVTGEGDEAPAILTTMQGYETDGELVWEMERRAGRTVTAAEVWMAATGRTDVPALLAEDHAIRAAAVGFDELVEKQVGGTPIFSFNAMFPLTTPNTCWARSKAVAISLNNSFPTVHVCTSDNPAQKSDSTFAQFVPVGTSSNCPGLATTLSVRTGMYNRAVNISAKGQFCFASNQQAWQCGAEVTVLASQYYVTAFSSTTSTHRLAVGATPIPIGLTFAGAVDMAAAVLLNGVPQFQSTKCGALF